MLRRILCAMLALGLLCTNAQGLEVSEAVRLHVVAADDSEAAQQLKRELRDVCLGCARICIADAADGDEAYLRLEGHLDAFESACRMRARELGYGGEIHAEAGVFDFPDRLYGNVLFPAGEYRALRITIGEGEGHNWWCVLYPTLCAINEEDAASDRMRVENILEWIRSGIGGF